MDKEKIMVLDDKQRHPVKIMVAGSRFSTSWKLKYLQWATLVVRLGESTDTGETYDEYKSMTKAQQGNIKDVGGFVGGEIKGKKRLNTNIKSRSLITLDLDHIQGQTADDVVEDYQRNIGCEAVFYSTHSHTDRYPRLRIVIPTNREMTPDEYEPVARKLAEASSIGLDAFDDTTFEVSRLMYWPSHPTDVEPYYKHVKGELVDVDTILSKYRDWKNVYEWPRSGRQDEIIVRAKKKQEDPLKKRGLIGAFCRTYPMTEAIDKFLSDVYEPSNRAGRYTYKAGSTYGGLVVYDDKFAYSFHSTDPASRHLYNAFDLVRVHLFGGLDDKAKPDTPSNRLPSYIKMMEEVQRDPEVNKQITEERIEESKDEFDYEEKPEEDTDWMGKLSYTKSGAIENRINNIVTIMDNDPRLKGRLKYDAFANRATVYPGVPWDIHKEEHDWQDLDDSGLHNYLETTYDLTNMGKVEDAKNIVFGNNSYHPVRDYFNALPAWDGVERIPTLLQDYLGAEDNLYTREVEKVHLTAAVKRVFEPGCKYDTMVILAGKQGIGKSTFIRILAKDWFSDSVYTIRGKEAAELIQGVWHIELGEMSAMKKSDRDAVKAFLSKADDQYRVAYAKNVSRFPRQCVFWGTSNEYNFLRDPTGDRRSFPIDCGITEPTKSVFHDLPEEVDQIWAEAYQLYKHGQKTYLEGEALDMSIEIQDEHKEDMPWKGVIQEYLETEVPVNWDDLKIYERQSYLEEGDNSSIFSGQNQKKKKFDRVCALQIWCELFNGKKQNLNARTTMQINDILTSLPGWERSQNSIRFGEAYGKQRGFVRVKSINKQED